MYKNISIVKLLIQAGADVSIKNKAGNTALQVSQNKEISDLLTKATKTKATNSKKRKHSEI